MGDAQYRRRWYASRTREKKKQQITRGDILKGSHSNISRRNSYITSSHSTWLIAAIATALGHTLVGISRHITLRGLQVIQCSTSVDRSCANVRLTLEVTNDNFHGVHRLELYIVAF